MKNRMHIEEYFKQNEKSYIVIKENEQDLTDTVFYVEKAVIIKNHDAYYEVLMVSGKFKNYVFNVPFGNLFDKEEDAENRMEWLILILNTGDIELFQSLYYNEH